MLSMKSGTRVLGLVLVMALAVTAWAGKRGGSPPPPAPAKPEIAYLGASNALYVMDADGSNQTAIYPTGKPPRGQSWNIRQPSWSPDGVHIAFSTSETMTWSSTWANQVWVVELDVDESSGTPVVTSDRLFFSDVPNTEDFVRWPSEGGFIAIQRNYGVDTDTDREVVDEVWVIPVSPRDGCPDPLDNGPALTPADLERGCGDMVLKGSVNDFPAWSPDDSQLIFGGQSTVEGQEDYWALLALDRATGEITDIPGTEIEMGGWYPPSNADLVQVGGTDLITFGLMDKASHFGWIIYGSINYETGKFEAWAEFGGGYRPSWSPDGRYIAVQGSNGRVIRLDTASDTYKNLNSIGGSPDWNPKPPQQ